jgi:uncharacterized protein
MHVITPWEGASKEPVGLVLDTNAVLDWLVFANPSMASAAAAVESGAVIWLACSRMREELARTLTHVNLAKWHPNVAHVLSTFDHHARILAAPPPSPARLRCTDPDDQVFIDLSLATKAHWLLTQDRALLALARHALGHGLRVLTPKAFNATVAGQEKGQPKLPF